jgi:hypothetical protein
MLVLEDSPPLHPRTLRGLDRPTSCARARWNRCRAPLCSEAEWVAIRKAQDNERICAKYGDDPDPAKQAALATWESDASVAAVKSACTSGLASVQDAWDAPTGG